MRFTTSGTIARLSRTFQGAFQGTHTTLQLPAQILWICGRCFCNESLMGVLDQFGGVELVHLIPVLGELASCCMSFLDEGQDGERHS